MERIDKLLAEGKEAEGRTEIKGINKDITLNNVSFRYESTKEDALENINFRPKKEKSSLVGKSGAGKTTFVDLISRFYNPSQGTISIDGADISGVTLQSPQVPDRHCKSGYNTVQRYSPLQYSIRQRQGQLKKR